MPSTLLDAASLRDRRRAVGLSQKALAVLAGVGAETVRRLETGITEVPHPRTEAAIARALRKAEQEEGSVRTGQAG